MRDDTSQVSDRMIQRLPLAITVRNRPAGFAGGASLPTNDAYLQNCYIEKDIITGDDVVTQRPGTATAVVVAGPSGQGLAVHRGTAYGVTNNTFRRYTASANLATSGANASTLAVTVGFTPRAYHGCVVLNGTMFVIGGEASGFPAALLNDVWASNDGVFWTQIVSAAPWGGRRRFGCTVFNNKIWITGGDTATGVQRDVWSSPDGVTWTQEVSSAPWAARRDLGCVAFNQGIWVYGGTTGPAYFNDVWFSEDGVTWVQQVAAAAWVARAYFATCVYQNKIWVFGGSNGAPLASCYSSVDGINWVNTGNLPAAAAQIKALVYSEKIWIVGVNNTNLHNTTDGNVFNLTQAVYAAGAILGAGWIVYRTPTFINTANADTMWIVARATGAGYSSEVRYSDLDVVAPSTWAISTSASNTTPFQFVTARFGDYLVLKNTDSLWLFNQGVVTKVNSQTTNYPPIGTVPGVVNLNETIYVMDPIGVIYGSNQLDPLTWDALNFISAEFKGDAPVALAQHQNYVVALKDTSTQFFYDAGNPRGSPLNVLVNANLNVGCAQAYSVVQTNNTLCWVARSAERGAYVVMLNGLAPVEISDWYVARLLSYETSNVSVTGFAYNVGGHHFYGLSSLINNWTVVYDFTTKQWHTLLYSGFSWPLNYSASVGSLTLMQNVNNGNLLILSEDYTSDDGGSIVMVIQTPIVDFGSNTRKFYSRVDLIGDRVNNTAFLYWYDDDYQTLKGGRGMNMNKDRPQAVGLGAARRRAFYIESSSTTAKRRFIALEIYFDQGIT